MWNKEHLDVFKICERERWQESYKRVFYLRSSFPATVKTSAPSRQQQTSCVLKCIFSAKLTGDTATICKLTKRNGVQRLYLKFYVQSESPGDLTAEKQTFPPQRRSNAHTKIIHATPSFFFFFDLTESPQRETDSTVNVASESQNGIVNRNIKVHDVV